MIECSAAGPHDNWPLQKGFDRFYGFLNGETDQFHPELTYDNHPIDPPAAPEDGYHVSEDLVDHAIEFVSDLRGVRPDRPFFTYLAFGATHAPHQAPPEYLAKYRGRFDDGLGRGPRAVVRPPAGAGHRARGHRAGPPQPRRTAVGRADATTSRPSPAASRRRSPPSWTTPTPRSAASSSTSRPSANCDNTIFVVISDNGASQEGGADGVMNEFQCFNGFPEDVDDIVAERLDDIGGPHSHTNYPWGWAQAGNTPLSGTSRTPSAAACATRWSCTGPTASPTEAVSATSSAT